MHEKIKALAKDRQSGAAEIAVQAAHLLLESPTYETAQALQQTHPEMAPLFNLCQLVIKYKNPKPAIKNFLKQINGASKIITAKTFPLIDNGDTLLTYSRSSMILHTLVSLHEMGKNFQVITPESRPGFEGKTLAQELGAAGIHTTLITDAASLTFMKKASIVITGADRVTPDCFVNKVGTLALALGAQHLSIPFYVLADTSKYVSEWNHPTDTKIYPESEILCKKLPGVYVKNPYFEEIPLSLVSQVISDKN